MRIDLDRPAAGGARAPAGRDAGPMNFVVDSPVGPLVLSETGGALSRVAWLRNGGTPDSGSDAAPSPVLANAARQLAEYFAGTRQVFDLPLAPAGGPFDQRVWAELCRIPYGETARYGDIAQALDTAAQPVGRACGANPIAIVIPCHRVVAATGLGGFSGGAGAESKRFLLRLEGALYEFDF